MVCHHITPTSKVSKMELPGYYDRDGVPINLIEKYMQIGVLWYGNQLRKQRKEDE